MDTEAAESGQRSGEPVRKVRGGQKMEEFVEYHKVGPMRSATGRVRCLEQELKHQTADEVDLFFWYTHALAEKDEQWITAFDDADEVNHLVGAKHEAQVFRQEQRLKPHEECGLRWLRQRWVRAEEKVLEDRAVAAFHQDATQHFVVEHRRRFGERQVGSH